MKNKILFPVVLIILFTINGCKDDKPCSTCPPPPKDMRNLTWTIDTLSYPGSFQTDMRRIWGSSSKDVYAVGHNDQNRGQMYHYDGIRWEPVKLSVLEGGNIAGPFDLADIYGFSTNNLYAVGKEIYWDPIAQRFSDSSLIIHFDGIQWNKIEIEKGGSLQALGGASSNDFWAGGGLSGTLYHALNGIPSLLNKTDSIGYLSFVGNSSNDVYSLAYQVDYLPLDSTRYYILHFDGSSWNLLDFYIETLSNLPWKFGTNSLWIDKNSEVFYSVGFGIYQKNGSSWMRIIESNVSFRHIYGSATNNIFVVGGDRLGYHFNGTDWKQLTELLNYPMISWYSAVWTDGEEVFIVGSDGYKSYVLHGK